MRIFIIIFFLVLFSSCGKMVMTYYGIKNPQIEDSTSITKYCKKKGLITENIYALDYQNFNQTMTFIGGSFPEIRIFNKAGFLIPYANSKTCNDAAFSFIDSLKSNKTYTIDTSVVFNDIADSLRNLSGKLDAPEMNENSDFYAFIFWTKWTGRLNKTHVIPWESKSLTNSNAKISVYKVNLDVQQWWDFVNDTTKINLEKTLNIKFENSN